MFLVLAENTNDTSVRACASLPVTAQEEVLLFKGWGVTSGL